MQRMMMSDIPRCHALHGGPGVNLSPSRSHSRHPLSLSCGRQRKALTVFLLDFSTTVMLSCLGAVAGAGLLVAVASAVAGEEGLAGAAGLGSAAPHAAQKRQSHRSKEPKDRSVTSRTPHARCKRALLFTVSIPGPP